MLRLARATEAIEEMDRPDCDPVLLRRTYAQFPLVNRVVAGWRSNYLECIRPLLVQRARARILDVGCGGGDIAANLARWALADGFEVAVHGIDPDPRAIGYARQALHRSKLPAGALEFRETTSTRRMPGSRFLSMANSRAGSGVRLMPLRRSASGAAPTPPITTACAGSSMEAAFKPCRPRAIISVTGTRRP